MDFLDTFGTLGGFLMLLIGFGFIIFVHELGHFLVAKAVGVKCTQFAIGMGPAICSFRKGMGFQAGSTEQAYDNRMRQWLAEQGEEPGADQQFTPAQYDRAAAAMGLGETEYRLSWVPLGGYVKMLGQEDLNPQATSADPRSFNSKPIWARACVISAGVVMNIIFGVIFFIIAFMAGVDFNAPVVGETSPLAPSAKPYAVNHDDDLSYKGLRTGDILLKLDEEDVKDLSEVKIYAALKEQGTPIRVTLDRPTDGGYERLVYDIVPEANAMGLLDLGFGPSVTLDLPADAEVDKWPPELRDAGVEPGMRLVEVDGRPVTQFYEFHRLTTAKRGEPVVLVFEHPKTGNRATVETRAAAGMMYHQVDTDRIEAHLAGMLPAVVIDSVMPDSPAAAAGLEVGDAISQIGSIQWPSRTDVHKTIRQADGAAVEVRVLRNRKSLTFSITPNDEGLIGIAMDRQKPVLRGVLDGWPLENANLPRGSRLLSVDGQDISTLADAQRVLMALAEKNPKGFSATVAVEPNAGQDPDVETIELTFTEAQAQAILLAEWLPPLSPPPFMMQMVPRKADNIGQALELGVHKTWQSMQQVYLTLLRVIQASVHPSNFQGPVGIAHTGTRIAKQGWTYLMFFLGLISVNLAVINFLPIPIVDGGHMVFLAIEKVKGSPVGPKVQTAALFAGLAMLACVFLYVTYNDILRLFGGV